MLEQTGPPEGADDVFVGKRGHDLADYTAQGKLRAAAYDAEMERLQEQLVLLQYWIQSQGLKVLVIFEGRGSAGKGGVIKRITERTSPRTVRVVALPKPTERERTQWYFQRYVEHLPAAGEMVLFDRSWYNRSNVEWVMGYCTEEEHQEFLRSCPEFERMLVRSGITRAEVLVLGVASRSSASGSRRATPSRSSAGSSPTWTSPSTSSTCATRWRRTRPSSTPTSSRRPGTSSPPTTSGPRGSTASTTCSASSTTRTSRPTWWSCPKMREMPYVRPPMHEQTFVPRLF